MDGGRVREHFIDAINDLDRSSQLLLIVSSYQDNLGYNQFSMYSEYWLISLANRLSLIAELIREKKSAAGTEKISGYAFDPDC
ncbi:MAG: hypothetical protein LBC07_04260 [Elusimicrobiota bacterium]|jgi:hypothetical protein|nr:hypothetical protein [Elusimicrobiota bacterium]